MSDKKEMGEAMLKQYDMPKEDALAKIFEAQEKFGSKFCNFKMYYSSKAGTLGQEILEWKDTFLDCIVDEVSETMNWLPWKHWKDYSDFKLQVQELRFELIDILHFITSEVILFGGDSEHVYDSLIESPRAAFSNVTDIEELLSYTKGQLLIETRVNLEDTDNKIKVSKGILRQILSYAGKGYSLTDPTKLNQVFLGIFFSLFQLFGLWDMTAQDVFNYYMSKNQENFDRQERGY